MVYSNILIIGQVLAPNRLRCFTLEHAAIWRQNGTVGGDVG